jgi:magnesium-transporting ATPase (P-type)
MEASDTHENNTNNQQSNTTQGTNESHKGDKGKKVVTSQPQIIDTLLNDSDSLNEDDNEDNNGISNDDDKAHVTIAATLNSRANNQNEFLPSKPNSIIESRTGNQVDFTSPRKILSRPNSALLGINSQDEHFSSLRTVLESNSKPNSRTLLDVNNQNDDYSISLGSNSRFQSCVNSQDDDYCIPLRRTNIPNYYPLSRTLYSKPTRPSPLGSSANVLNIHNNTFNNNSTHLINEEIPSPFNEMTIYQLCSWLCMNPNVLQLANNMHLSMQTPVIEGSRFMSSISTGSLIPTSNQENKTKACRDFLEELKCLFLRI